MEKEKIKLTQKKAENSPAGGVVVGERDGQTMIYNDASVGGYFVGKTHSKGGIKMINKSNGQPLEVQGSEVIITAPAVADQTKREFEGKMMTNREILSAINEKGGGVAFAKGGDIPKDIKRTGASYKYGGKTMTDHEIYKYITGGHLAEGYSLREIASIHQVPLSTLKSQVRMGMKAESEHTSSKREQMLIVKDHLFENPEYYTLLKKSGLEDGGLIAPNGKKSNLTPEQYKLVRTPEFKAWFGDWENDPENASKVIDENGEPLVCYHGGKTKFNIFSPYSEGHYFTDNIKYAKAFVENNDDGYLFKCFINVRNYLDARKLSPPTPSFNEINEKELMMFFKKNGIYSKEMEESIKDFFANKFQPKTFWNYLRYYGSDIPSSYKEIYDAIFLNENTLNGTKINAYFVHKPNQIKLADGTNTTFDSDNDDIRYADGGYVSYKDKYNRKYNYDKNTSHTLKEISKDTGVSMKGLQQIYNKGIGAYKTNPESVRPNVKSKEQWAMARVYSAVMGGKASKVDSNELKMNKGGGIFNTEPFLNYYFDEIAEFLKYQNDILLNKDFTFKYKGELFRIEPIILSENNIKEANFSIIDSEDEEVGEIKFNPDDKKQFFAYSHFFEWNNLKFDNGGELKTHHKEHESLVRDAKRGNNPARDLNNYNDVLDIDADGVYGAETGLYANGGLIAPNGKKSNLTPEQYKLVRTPEFKAWFGDWENDPENASKVVDENGEPLVVYHGSKKKFNVFSLDYIGKNTGSLGFLGIGFYFATNKSDAENYGEIVKPYFLNSLKKLDLSNIEYKELAFLLPNLYMRNGKKWKDAFIEIDKIKDEIKSVEIEDLKNGFFNVHYEYKDNWGMISKRTIHEIESDNGISLIVNKIIEEDPNNIGAIGNYFNTQKLTEEIKNEGFDSVMSNGTNPFDLGDEIVVFKPNQIKLADGTNKKFDNMNPDIRYADGGDVKPYDANMEGDSADMMFAEGGAVSSVVKNWNEVPSIWKDTAKIKKVAFTNSPYDKGLYSIVAPFLGKDDLRPIMTGINFDDNGITVTNAHVLVSLPYPSKEFEGVYEADLSKRANPEQINIEGNYPNYPPIIPKKEVTKPFFIDIYKLLQYNNVAMKFTNKTTYAVNYKIDNDKAGFNAKFLNESLKTLLKLGHETAYAHYIAPNKALLLTPSKDYELGNDELVLTMPVMIKDNDPLGARDMDYERALSVYYDFNDNEIHNADGSIAEFKMKYQDNSVISKEDVNLLQKLANGKNKMPILDYVKVENGVARASDLDSEYYLSGVELPNGIYKPNNGALEITMEAIDDYPRNPIFVSDEDTLEFIINSDVLEYYVDKFQNVVKKDDLRPVLQGICLHHTSDNKLFLVATDTFILMKINITEYVDMPTYNKDMKFIIQPKSLYDFLNSTEHTTLRIKSNLVATTIESDKWSFYARNIDGNYPNYEAVIPRDASKLVSVDIEPIKKAFNTEMVKNYVKEAYSKDKVFIFNEDNEIFIGTNIGGENIKKICDTNVDFKLEDFYNDNKNVLLIMPFIFGKQTNFSFRKDLVERVFKIVNTNKLELHYSEMNRAYLIPIDTFEFKTTTKEHKVREQKPSVAEVQLVSTINEVNEIKEAIETLEMLLETATRKDKKEIKEAIEVLQMLLDTYEY